MLSQGEVLVMPRPYTQLGLAPPKPPPCQDTDCRTVSRDSCLQVNEFSLQYLGPWVMAAYKHQANC